MHQRKWLALEHPGIPPDQEAVPGCPRPGPLGFFTSFSDRALLSLPPPHQMYKAALLRRGRRKKRRPRPKQMSLGPWLLRDNGQKQVQYPPQ